MTYNVKSTPARDKVARAVGSFDELTDIDRIDRS